MDGHVSSAAFLVLMERWRIWIVVLAPVLTIWNNTKLRHISDILPINITGPKPVYYFSNNSRFCHTVDVVQKIEAKVGMKLNWTKSCCEFSFLAGFIQYLVAHYCRYPHFSEVMRGRKCYGAVPGTARSILQQNWRRPRFGSLHGLVSNRSSSRMCRISASMFRIPISACF